VNTAADLTNPLIIISQVGVIPLLMTADVTLNGITKNCKICFAARKQSKPSPRLSLLHVERPDRILCIYTLNHLFPDDNIIILGDFNDDL
jgi:hypothetical protein